MSRGRRNRGKPSFALPKTAPALPTTVAQDKQVVYDGLQNVLAGLGTDRDKMSGGTYAAPKLLDRQTLENMYRCSWLARKIIDIPAKDMTRKWRRFMFDDEKVLEANQFVLEQAERKLAVRKKFTSAMIYGRLYGGGVLLLGVGKNQYDQPLDPATVKKGDLKFIRAFDRWTCQAEGVIDWDITSENFGKPLFYRIGTAQNQARVHYSRLIRFGGDELPYFAAMTQNQWDDPILQVIYETLLGRDTVTAGIATMMFEANVDVIKDPAFGDLVGTADGEAKVIKRYQLSQLMKSFNRTLVLGADEEYDKKSNSFSGLDAIMREFRAEIAGAADIPVTRLFGTGVSGLNATGDNEVRQYYDKISGNQETDLAPQLHVFDEIFIRSTLGAMPDDYRFEFNPLWQMSATDKAAIDFQNAQRDDLYIKNGVVSEGVVARELKENGTYATMTEEDVEMAEELSEVAMEARTTGLETAANADPADDAPDGGQAGKKTTKEGEADPAKPKGGAPVQK